MLQVLTHLTSDLAAKKDFIALKAKIDKLYIVKLVNVKDFKKS